MREDAWLSGAKFECVRITKEQSLLKEKLLLMEVCSKALKNERLLLFRRTFNASLWSHRGRRAPLREQLRPSPRWLSRSASCARARSAPRRCPKALFCGATGPGHLGTGRGARASGARRRAGQDDVLPAGQPLSTDGLSVESGLVRRRSKQVSAATSLRNGGMRPSLSLACLSSAGCT